MSVDNPKELAGSKKASLSCIQRHILAWYSGEEPDDEDKMSHLSHIMACCAVLLDSQKLGVMKDDRPINSTPVRPIFDQIKEDKA